MSPTGPDNEFEDFLARRSTLLQRMSDQDRVEPPAELDRIVLTQARAAIEAPAYQPMYRAPRWALPVALAATIVLSVAVSFDLLRSTHHAKRAEPMSPPAEREMQAAAKSSEFAAGSLAAASPTPAEHALAARAKRVDAQAWLAQIERLRADGKIAEANEQLAEYRKAFPRRAAPSAAAPAPPSR